MSELTKPTRSQSKIGRLWQQMINNPVTTKELRSRMRGRRAFIVLTVYLLLMGAFVSLIYLGFYVNSGTDVSSTRQAGQTIFITMLVVQGFLVVFIGPSFTAGAISGEKERQTYDLLRTTLLSPQAFVMGKLLSAMSYVFLLLFAAVPLISLAFMLGGVATSEVILSQLVLLVSGVTFAMMGLYFSSSMRTTMAASVTTYASALFITIGTPIIAVIVASIMASIIFTSGVPWFVEAGTVYLGLILVATNLPATMIVSDMFLRSENTLWGFTEVVDTVNVWFFSPWYVFLIFYLLLTLFLYRRTVKKVAVIANK
ncbi:MAG: hypothetical protein KDE51_21855 [Anaerolineales bacterium]|nr:hypothetical protein [Anaerolineales bacterium]